MSAIESLPDTSFVPEIHELKGQWDVEASLAALAELPHCVLFDSASPSPAPNGMPLGRYTFLAADPWQWEVRPIAAAFPDPKIRGTLEACRSKSVAGLPPFQGGWCGLLGYELLHSLEVLPFPRENRNPQPPLQFGWYDTVVAWDHELGRSWIVSQGWPEFDPVARRQRARTRLGQFRDLLADVPVHPDGPLNRLTSGSPGQERLPPDAGAGSLPGLQSNFSRAAYLAAVQQVIDYIFAGDIFQANLAQTLVCNWPADRSPVELYSRLRKENPAPFAAYLDTGTARILSTSPERLISLRGDRVETRPIKGTRRRTGVAADDAVAEAELMASQKDRAENVMIVDLMRNDLSRVCEDPSIRVTQLCGLESYASVIHLVSAVEGQLRSDRDVWDLLAAVFPGGSITGAPKIRAMEIIAELEPTARNAYCGSLGYVGFDGTADFNILIRTVTEQAGRLQIPVGGGIVAQSDPAREYEETWTKAAAMLRAIGGMLDS